MWRSRPAAAQAVAIIAVLRAKGLPSMLEHADSLERQLEQHAPEQASVTLSLTDNCPTSRPPTQG